VGADATDDPASDLAWARRAHPLAALYRIALAEPLIVLALYSRAWFDWVWIALFVAAVAQWWLAPRLAPPASETADGWATLATRGERLWQEGRAGDGARTLGVLSAAAGLCFGAGLIGALFLVRPLAVLATALAVVAKLLLAERLARLYEATVTPADGGSPPPIG
jgi:hypothetical protein